jgi:hypothetical protein
MEKLYQAIQNWYKASAAYDKAFEGYEGYSWGWAGAYEIEQRQHAAEEFEKALNEVIDERVRKQVAILTGKGELK